MKNTADLFEAGETAIMASIHKAEFFTFDEAWLQAHRMTYNQALVDCVWDEAHLTHYNNTRMGKFLAEISAPEMQSNRDYDATVAWDKFLAEEERKSN